MRDEPQGRFVMRTKGMAIKAKRFHLYRDCGVIAPFVEQPEDFEIIDLNGYPDKGGSIIDLLGLTVCSPCHNRANEVSALDVIADVLADWRDIESQTPINVDEADMLASRVTASLEAHGYRIRRERRGGPGGSKQG